jgi:hypothetical protein
MTDKGNVLTSEISSWVPCREEKGTTELERLKATEEEEGRKERS